MRAFSTAINILAVAIVALFSATATIAAPLATFQPDTLSVTASGTFRTPAIVITGATGVSMVTLGITLPQGVSISTTTSSGNLACVTKGTSVSGLFFSEWDSNARKISVTCSVNPGATLEVVRSIQFTTLANVKTSQMTLDGSLTGGSGPALFGSLTIAPPHAISISSCTVSPTDIDSAGTAACNIEAEDSANHSVTYLWSDGGRGGSFTPASTAQAPTYHAPANNTASAVAITISCKVTCTENAAVTTTATNNLSVRAAPPKTIQVTSTPNSGVPIIFSPAPDAVNNVSPRVTPMGISYRQTATGIVVTAPKQDGATRARWFDHWTLDGADQPQGQVAVTLSMNGTNHTLQAVYGTLVGDLNNDGAIDKTDAQMIMKAILGDISQTPAMDVDQSGTVNLNDSRWILVHRS